MIEIKNIELFSLKPLLEKNSINIDLRTDLF